ncbi:MAG: hypothetical protein VX640_01405 [Pseudomonadota bacterium]|nr:hypothetical protein [Pseudomonadota bacterium]
MPLKKKQPNAFAQTQRAERKPAMSRNHVQATITAFGQFVNITAVVAAVALIGFGYFSAIGQFAGAA